jgi:hypothetical protein
MVGADAAAPGFPKGVYTMAERGKRYPIMVIMKQQSKRHLIVAVRGSGTQLEWARSECGHSGGRGRAGGGPGGGVDIGARCGSPAAGASGGTGCLRHSLLNTHSQTLLMPYA